MLKSNYILTKLFFGLAIIATTTTLLAQPANAAEYVFPIIGPASYTNDFNAPRFNGQHGATDIFADKHQKVVSRSNGVVTQIDYPLGDTSSTAGYYVIVRDGDTRYLYLHLNNDNKGTDDGKGSTPLAYGPDLVEGRQVVKGQLIGFVGDSGNAEGTPPHLHFEITKGDGDDRYQVNPYYPLKNNSYRVSKPKSDYPRVGDEILPVNTDFRGGATVALGDVDDDNQDEIITGSGPGGRYLKIFETNGSAAGRFEPNGSNFKGGVDVATGDVDGDGVDEIITAAGKGGYFVKIFEGDGESVSRFMPNGTSFNGGMNVAVGDVDGDGVDEIVVGPKSGGSFIKVFEADGSRISKFKPYEGLNGGIDVAVGDTHGDAAEEIITGPQRGNKSRINVYDITDGVDRLYTRYAYAESFRGGVRVSAADITDSVAKDEIITIPQSEGSARVKMFVRGGQNIRYSNYFEGDYWRGNYDLAASDNFVYSSLGVNRRTSIRDVNGLQ